MKTYFRTLHYFLVLLLITFIEQVSAVPYTKTYYFSDEAGWRFETAGKGSKGRIRTTSGGSGWTTYTAELTVNAVNATYWAGIGRKFTFPSNVSQTSTSYARMWAKQPVFLHMEVINPDTWTYVAVTRSWQFPGTQFGSSTIVKFPAFSISTKPVYFRIALMGLFPSQWVSPANGTIQMADVDSMVFSNQ